MESTPEENTDWQAFGKCVKDELDPEMFFPEKGADPVAAKAVCNACDVRVECLEFALAAGEKFGIFGGKDSTERRRIRWARHFGYKDPS